MDEPLYDVGDHVILARRLPDGNDYGITTGWGREYVIIDRLSHSPRYGYRYCIRTVKIDSYVGKFYVYEYMLDSAGGPW